MMAAERDAVAVHWAEGERFQDQKVEGALQQSMLFNIYACSLQTMQVRGEAFKSADWLYVLAGRTAT